MLITLHRGNPIWRTLKVSADKLWLLFSACRYPSLHGRRNEQSINSSTGKMRYFLFLCLCLCLRRPGLHVPYIVLIHLHLCLCLRLCLRRTCKPVFKCLPKLRILLEHVSVIRDTGVESSSFNQRKEHWSLSGEENKRKKHYASFTQNNQYLWVLQYFGKPKCKWRVKMYSDTTQSHSTV